MLECKYGCGMTFPDKASLMRHYRWECENSPSVKKWKAKKSEIKEKKSSAVTENKAPVDTVKTGMEEIHQEMLQEIKFLRTQKELENLRSLYSGDKKESSDDGNKVSKVVDGVSLKVTPQEMLAWKRYELDLKREEEEREERKSRSGGGSDVAKLREEISLMREGFLQTQIESLRSQLSEDPLTKILQYKKQLDELGGGARKTATDQMYSMDMKKLDTFLTIFLEKSQGKTPKFDRLLDSVGPVGKQYLQEMIANMRQMRGATMPEAKRTDKEYDDIYKKLSKMDLEDLQKLEDSLAKQELPVDKPTSSEMDPEKKDIDVIPVVEPPKKKVISIPPKKSKGEQKKTKEVATEKVK